MRLLVLTLTASTVLLVFGGFDGGCRGRVIPMETPTLPLAGRGDNAISEGTRPVTAGAG